MEDAAQPTTRLALVDQTNGQLPLLYLGSGSCALLASRPDCARQRGTREASLGMALSWEPHALGSVHSARLRRPSAHSCDPGAWGGAAAPRAGRS